MAPVKLIELIEQRNSSLELRATAHIKDRDKAIAVVTGALSLILFIRV